MTPVLLALIAAANAFSTSLQGSTGTTEPAEPAPPKQKKQKAAPAPVEPPAEDEDDSDELTTNVEKTPEELRTELKNISRKLRDDGKAEAAVAKLNKMGYAGLAKVPDDKLEAVIAAFNKL